MGPSERGHLERFDDRADAGRKLAKRLQHLSDESTVVLGLARGGVLVAAEVARVLRRPLDVLVVRKLGAPFQPELGIGALAPGGVCFLDHGRIREYGITPEQLAPVLNAESEEINRRLAMYQSGPPLNLEGRTVIVVDDGLATGVTAIAAARYVRSKGPKRIVLAVPVCAPEAAHALAQEVDEVVCVVAPDSLMAVGYWYADFRKTEDSEVLDSLGRSAGSDAA